MRFVICELYLNKAVKSKYRFDSCNNFNEGNIWGYKKNVYVIAISGRIVTGQVKDYLRALLS